MRKKSTRRGVKSVRYIPADNVSAPTEARRSLDGLISLIAREVALRIEAEREPPVDSDSPNDTP
jgi:hypothetical protein